MDEWVVFSLLSSLLVGWREDKRETERAERERTHFIPTPRKKESNSLEQRRLLLLLLLALLYEAKKRKSSPRLASQSNRRSFLFKSDRPSEGRNVEFPSVRTRRASGLCFMISQISEVEPSEKKAMNDEMLGR